MEKYYKSYDITETGSGSKAGRLLLIVLCIVSLLLLASRLMASGVSGVEKITISGVVYDAETEEPLPGVNVVEKGTTNGTVTDIDGRFTLQVDYGVVLVISYIGYTSEEITLDGTISHLDIPLAEDITTLDEVVVIGYGTSVSRSICGATSGLSPAFRIGGKRGSKKGKSSSGSSNNQKGGKLTVGEINDFSKWNLWTDIAENELNSYSSAWQVKPKQRYTYQLMNDAGYPIIDAKVRLINEMGNVVWRARTDNNGRAELWNSMFESHSDSTQSFSIEVEVAHIVDRYFDASVFHNGVNFHTMNNICFISDTVDIAFVVDATGSMGDEIEYLKAELQDVIGKVKEQNKDVFIRLGSVFYRDHGDEYITRKSDLSDDIDNTITFIGEQHAGGGGDFPEAVDDALDVAVHNLNWSQNARSRILFLILDAPPHQTAEITERLHHIIADAAAQGIRVVPITCSGIDKSTEFLMRSMALATNGTYVFLTDDSGIGGAHLKPTTDKYDVELMNKTLLRIIYQFCQTTSCLSETTLAEDNDSKILDEIEYTIQKSELTEKSDDTEKTDRKTKKLMKEEKLNLYPNPTYGEVNFKQSLPGGELYLIDMSGKLLNKYSVAGLTEAQINISEYPSGVYFIRYVKGTDSLVGKVVLTR